MCWRSSYGSHRTVIKSTLIYDMDRDDDDPWRLLYMPPLNLKLKIYKFDLSI